MQPTGLRRALLSVSDKTGLVPFARRLADAGYELVSTGGTWRTIANAGVPVRYVTEITGQTEVFGGRVKTLHPIVHGGILYRRDVQEHVEQAEQHGIAPIDIVVVNLYPFAQTVADPNVTLDGAIEQIDIGGPAMVRAAAKNHDSVAIVVSPSDYDEVAEAVESGTLDLALRRRLALQAFRHTAAYDAAIAAWLGTQAGDDALLPSFLPRTLRRDDVLRYGENPHQRAALYQPVGGPELSGARVLQGKALSYNNLVDADAAIALVREFDLPAAVVIKHTNPCGTGVHPDSIVDAYRRALEADPVSAFGGIVALNRAVDGALGAELAKLFLEVIAAPGFDDAALGTLGAKTALRLLDTTDLAPAPAVLLRDSALGVLAQTADPAIDQMPQDWTVATERAPTEEEWRALRFLWRVCKHVKSNAIVIGSAERTYGVGAGQMSRVDSVRLAIAKATGPVAGAALASDAFFPFRDALDAAAEAGVRAVVQPGGSKRDDEVIAAANEHGIAMVFSHARHFRH